MNGSSQNIYGLLKEKIIWLELAPESVLNVSELAKEFGVSRTPVKEALILLQAEEWVIRNGSHFLITPLSLDRIRDISEIRSVLEIQAATWALQRISKEEISELLSLRKEMVEIDGGLSFKTILKIDFRFHKIIYKAIHNNQIEKFLEHLHCHYIRFWLAFPQEPDRDKFFTTILDAIGAFDENNEEKMIEIMTDHIRTPLSDLMGEFIGTR